jgi:hypothetical protein
VVIRNGVALLFFGPTRISDRCLEFDDAPRVGVGIGPVDQLEDVADVGLVFGFRIREAWLQKVVSIRQSQSVLAKVYRIVPWVSIVNILPDFEVRAIEIEN